MQSIAGPELYHLKLHSPHALVVWRARQRDRYNLAKQASSTPQNLPRSRLAMRDKNQNFKDKESGEVQN